MRARTTTLVMGLLSALSVPLMAQDATPAPSPPPACTDADYRQFDFWIGDWEVFGGPDGSRLLGHNRIERSDNGCWLQEHWTGTTGPSGTSLNSWDKAYGVWRQYWSGGGGMVLRLEGGLREGRMVLEGVLPGPGGEGEQAQRITWTPNDDGSVTQLWETSDDAGATWKTAFQGRYRKRATADPATP
ncbi:hypothetical protein [Luteimonas vadosa]|uniref:DUF1579 domain-containing protein n=1 Tax=Luteimonas vadosa TaxID=1165507 RepID=A0ABP9DQJ4_9GAMM